VFEADRGARKYTPLRRFPTSAFDVSVIAGLRALTAEVGGIIGEAGGADCLSVEYLYSYKGKPLEDDQQSLTYRVTVGVDDRTLTTEEVLAVRERIFAALTKAGYTIR
jgi:phenylalanyl-tRNA synthetase beta chain